MLKIENVCVSGWEAAIRGMRNPYDSWEKSDSHICPRSENFVDCIVETLKCPRVNNDFTEDVFCVGKKDLYLMQDLVTRGDCHSKFTRMLIVTMDVTAPLYWWKQASTYKVATVENSCSTMHTIMKTPFSVNDFSYEKDGYLSGTMPYVVQMLNDLRFQYTHEENPTEKKKLWEAVIQLCPESYLQKRTWQMDYQTLRNIWTWRRAHLLTEWVDFCKFIERLPYAKELITVQAKKDEKDRD